MMSMHKGLYLDMATDMHSAAVFNTAVASAMILNTISVFLLPVMYAYLT